jgi:uncharacterized protein (TIGR00156 family)
MKKTVQFLTVITLCLCSCATAHAGWGEDLQSIKSVKERHMDDCIVYVKGEITDVIDDESFKLRDDTGEILVHLDNSELEKHRFHSGMRVEIRGRVDREHRHHYDLEATAVKFHDGTIIGKE